MTPYLLFHVDRLLAGLPLRAVLETARLVDVEPVPAMPSYVRGITRLRGANVCVLDLAVFLGSGASATARRLVTVRAGNGAAVALLVEDVVGIRHLDGEALPALLGDATERAMVELARLDGELLALLEAGRLPSPTFEPSEAAS